MSTRTKEEPILTQKEVDKFLKDIDCNKSCKYCPIKDYCKVKENK